MESFLSEVIQDKTWKFTKLCLVFRERREIQLVLFHVYCICTLYQHKWSVHSTEFDDILLENMFKLSISSLNVSCSYLWIDDISHNEYLYPIEKVNTISLQLLSTLKHGNEK